MAKWAGGVGEVVKSSQGAKSKCPLLFTKGAEA